MQETHKLAVWDTAGQERFRSLLPLYLRNCTLALICFDLTNGSSFNGIEDWVKRLRAVDALHIAIVGCKSDLKRIISSEQVYQLASELDVLYFETSAKDRVNIEEMMAKFAEILPK